MPKLYAIALILALILPSSIEAKINAIAYDQDNNLHDWGFLDSGETNIGYHGVDIGFDYLETTDINLLIHSVDTLNHYDGFNIFSFLSFDEPDNFTEKLSGHRFMIGMSTDDHELLTNVHIYKAFYLGYEEVTVRQKGYVQEKNVDFSASVNSVLARLTFGVTFKNIFFDNLYIRPHYSVVYKTGDLTSDGDTSLIQYNPHDKFVFASGIQFGITF